MKTSSNLAGKLRTLFATLRILLAVFTAVLVLLTVVALCANAFGSSRRTPLVLSFDPVQLGMEAKTLGLEFKATGDSPGRVNMDSLQGYLTLEVFGPDRAMTAAVWQGFLPRVVLLFGALWFLLGFLRDLCENLARGEVFSESNLTLGRRIGWLLVGSAVVDIATRLWAHWIVGGYLRSHVIVSSAAGKFPMEISLQGEAFDSLEGVVTGLLVLVLCEAFRQGLALKAENDLTV